ncbi:MAG TPA: methylated-DNA--[protein]-cysteine S-methyltransferase [Methanoregula sp.]|nr:methylated-DNA--[protein]-cysteine S-methyltransferase [Methanoregula sp.]
MQTTHLPIMSTVFPTPFGRIRLAWVNHPTGPLVTRIALPDDPRAGREEFPPAIPLTQIEDNRIGALIRDIRSFLSGEDVVFGTEVIDLDRCRPFQRSVLLAEHAIPRGYVSTYGRIARHLGIPGGARAVGTALANNPFPLVIPCHRALRADGSPGGFQGGTAMKIRLLEMEGALFRPDGKVLMDHLWY